MSFHCLFQREGPSLSPHSPTPPCPLLSLSFISQPLDTPLPGLSHLLNSVSTLQRCFLLWDQMGLVFSFPWITNYSPWEDHLAAQNLKPCI